MDVETGKVKTVEFTPVAVGVKEPMTRSWPSQRVVVLAVQFVVVVYDVLSLDCP
jgi:hypothetical protein